MKEVEIDTWDEIEQKIPEFSRMDKLEKFNIQKGKPLLQDFKVHTYITAYYIGGVMLGTVASSQLGGHCMVAGYC